MTSGIIFSTIDTTYPIPGRDNDSQGFRTNFSIVKTGLEVAQSEISLLQANKADLVQQSKFANNTPSVSTDTGALTVVGGVGIGGDLNVNGSISSNQYDVMTTATSAPGVINSDITFTGTYGQPTYKVNLSLAGDRQYSGSLSVGTITPDPGHIRLYVATTGSSQIGAFIKTSHINATALKLSTYTTNGLNFTYIHFVKTPNGVETTLAKLATDGTNILFNEGVMKFCQGGLAVASAAPATADAAGTVGAITWDSGYVYICIADNTWKRAALTTWP
jgi:hypothetical protein